jgi:hypothetical protein
MIANGSVGNIDLASDTARLNLLTNGGFEIWQRGNGPFTASGAYTADRWIIGLNGSSTMSVSRYNASSGPSGAVSYAAQVIYTHNTSSWLMQAIKTGEYQELRGRTVTFSASVFSNTNNAARLSVASDGTGGSTVYSPYATGASTWQSLSATYTVPVDSTVVNVRLWLDASCTAYVDNAMLVVGSQPADYAPLHPADDLARCLRYYEAQNSSILDVYQAAAGAHAFTSVKLIPKAVSPTLTFSGQSYLNASALSATAYTDHFNPQLTATAAGEVYCAYNWIAEANP